MILLLVGVVYLSFGQNPSTELELKTRRLQVAGQLRLALSSASEAEKSAVLATTDEDSQRFADQARAATAETEKKRSELEALLAGRDQERELLAQFSAAFARFQQIDRQLLDLAVRNTNLKASALLFGPLADVSQEMDSVLSRVIAQSKSRRAMQLAAGAQAALFRIQVLLPPHIAAESDAKMDALEARMRKEDQAVRQDLDELQSDGSGEEARKASAIYARFSDLKVQILKLSRENTNVRSLAISLNEKRAVAAMCQSALAALETAIGEEPAPHRVRAR